MSLVVKAKVYENASEGLHNVKITRIDDLGLIESAFGTKDKVRIVFQTEEEDKEGKFIDIAPRFTKSLHEKSELSKLLRALKVTAKDSFDLNDLVGTKLQVVVEHVKKDDGKVFANITSYLKPTPGAKKPVKPTLVTPNSEPEVEDEVETDEI